MPFSRLKTYSESDQQLANSVIELLIQFAMKKEKREYEFLCLTAEQRYRALIEQSPELIKRVTQNDLAKYLGVTAVGLSRIKKTRNGKYLVIALLWCQRFAIVFFCMSCKQMQLEQVLITLMISQTLVR